MHGLEECIPEIPYLPLQSPIEADLENIEISNPT
jgi:hypothetical protein